MVFVLAEIFTWSSETHCLNSRELEWREDKDGKSKEQCDTLIKFNFLSIYYFQDDHAYCISKEFCKF